MNLSWRFARTKRKAWVPSSESNRFDLVQKLWSQNHNTFPVTSLAYPTFDLGPLTQALTPLLHGEKSVSHIGEWIHPKLVPDCLILHRNMYRLASSTFPSSRAVVILALVSRSTPWWKQSKPSISMIRCASHFPYTHYPSTHRADHSIGWGPGKFHPFNFWCSKQTTYQRMRSDFKSTLPQNRPSMVAKIKGPYQPRSVLTRTRDAYGLGTRKKSKKKLSDRADELSDGADSDDSSISPAYHDQSFDTKSEYDSTRLNSLSHQMPMSQSRFGLQSVQEEESYQTDYPTYHHDLSRSPHDTRLFQGEEHRYTKDTPMDHLETWVASALQDPTFLNQPSPSTGQKGFAPTDPSRSGSFGVSAALPHQSGFNPHTTSTYPLRDPVSSQQIPTHQPAYQAYAPSPLNLPKPTTPLNIRKSIAKSPPSQSAFATSTAPSTARHQPPTTPGRPTLVAQPWSRVRNNQARSLPHQPSTPHQASSRPRIASTSHLPSILKTSAPPPRRPSAPSHYIPTSARSPTFPVESPHTKLDHQHRQTNQGHRLMAPPPGLMGESSNAFETPRRAPAQPSGFKAFCAPFLRTWKPRKKPHQWEKAHKEWSVLFPWCFCSVYHIFFLSLFFFASEPFLKLRIKNHEILGRGFILIYIYIYIYIFKTVLISCISLFTYKTNLDH